MCVRLYLCSRGWFLKGFTSEFWFVVDFSYELGIFTLGKVIL